MPDFSTVELILTGARLYAGMGLAVGLAFLLFGIDRCAPSAQGAYGFRPLLMPGLVLLWPLVLVRWRAILADQRKG